MNNEMQMPKRNRLTSKLEKSHSLQTFQQNCKFRESVKPVDRQPAERMSHNLKDFMNTVASPYDIGAHRSGLQRIKSAETLHGTLVMKGDAYYEGMMEIYKNQNENLQKQNRFLIKELRKQKRNQQALCGYVEQLRNQIQALQHKNLIENTQCCKPKPKLRNLCVSKLTTSVAPSSPRSIGVVNVLKRDNDRTNMDTFYSSGVMITQQDEEEPKNPRLSSEIEQLTHRFNCLMNQCSQETNKKVRDVLRMKLAETAHSLKLYRKDSSAAI